MASIKELFRSIAALPLVWGFWRSQGPQVCVLNYHRVTDDPSAAERFNPNRPISVTAKSFDQQMRFLKKRFTCLSSNQLIEGLTHNNLPRHGVVVTFDDGYLDNMTVALPIAEKYGIPITVFVTTGFMERTASLWWEEQRFILERVSTLRLSIAGQKDIVWDFQNDSDRYVAATKLRHLFKSMRSGEQVQVIEQLRAQCSERYSYDSEILSWDQLRQFAQHPLVTIGAHTEVHSILALQEEKEVEQELSSSRERLLQQLAGKNVDFLAYPMGQREHANVREFKVAEKTGFKAAFTTVQGLVTPGISGSALYSLPRIAVSFNDSLNSFAWRIYGF